MAQACTYNAPGAADLQPLASLDPHFQAYETNQAIAAGNIKILQAETGCQ